MTHPDHLDRRDAAKLRGIRGRDPDLDRLTRHVRAFAAMMTGRHGDRLDTWITDVEARHPATPGRLRQQPAPRPRRRPPRPDPALQLRPSRRQHQPAQDAQTPDVRPRQPRPAAQTRTPGPLTHHTISDRTKIREGQVANRPVYLALGVTVDGSETGAGPVGRRARRRGGSEVLAAVLSEVRSRAWVMCASCAAMG